MKKLLILALALMMVFTLAACGGNTDPEPSGSGGDNYDDEEFTIVVDESDKWTPFEGESNVAFENSADEVVSITDDGKEVTFEGLAVGESVITASCGDKTAKARVKVIKRSMQQSEFTGPFEYNPPTDNFCFEVKTTENGKSTNITFAKIGSEEAMIVDDNDWQQFANISTGAYYTVVDGRWIEDTSWGFYTFEESGGLGSPFDNFNEFFKLLSKVGFGNEKLKDFYVDDETFLGVKCWVFDTNGYNNIYAKYWVDPSNGCTLKKSGTTTDIVTEVTEYNLNYTEWDSNFLPNFLPN